LEGWRGVFAAREISTNQNWMEERDSRNQGLSIGGISTIRILAFAGVAIRVIRHD